MKVRFNNKFNRFEGFENGDWNPITPGTAGTDATIPLVIDRYRVEVSLACNLQCEYCVVHKNDVRQQNTIMDLSTAQMIVNKFNDEIGKNGSIFLMGGEPLVNYSVVEYIIENVKGESIIFTNALKLNDEVIDFLYRHNTYILTSLDGYSMEQNAKRFQPNIKENFEIVTANIKRAIERGCKVGVSCLLHSGNIYDAEKIATYFVKEFNARAMSFAYPHATVKYTEESEFDFSEYANQMKKLYLFAKQHKVYIDQIGKIISPLYYNYSAIIGCKAGTTQRTFYPDGSETICTKIDTLKNFSMEKYKNNLPFRIECCSECIAKYICCGECPWDYAVADLSGNAHERICSYRKYLISFIIDDICKELSTANNCKEAEKVFENICFPLINNYYDE